MPDTRPLQHAALDLDAARATAARFPDPAPGTLVAHLHAALAEVDRLRALVAAYGSPIGGRVPAPPVDAGWERMRAERQRLEETGTIDQKWAEGRGLCSAGVQCPSHLLAAFELLKNGRIPMHRSGEYGPPCPGARKMPAVVLRYQPKNTEETS